MKLNVCLFIPCILAVSSPLTIFAESGKQLYATYCSACHSTDGKGATGGAFPPLANSPWVNGKPERAIQTVLHGLAGKIDVLGKEYNLVMPPQGAVLSDPQIASILTYVRSSWGNNSDAVKPDQVKAARAASANRNKPWTAPELDKLHPLPQAPSPITDLIRYTYEGEQKKMPDFSKLESTSVEEEHHGLLNLKNIAAKDHFGVVWEGKLNVPKSGKFTFTLASDDISALYLDGKKVAEVIGSGPISSNNRRKTARIDLKQGTVPIKVEYYEHTGQQGIELSWRGPKTNGTQWLSEDQPKQKRKRKPPVVIDLTPTGQESAIYNHFLNGTTPRSLAVGHPNGTNFAFSTKNCSLDMIWSGKFISAGRHWTGRGTGRTDPLGSNRLPLGGKGFVTDAQVQFKGYTLNKLRQPILRYTVANSTITDAILPGKTNQELVRNITIKGKETLTFSAVSGIPVEQLEKNTYQLAGSWKLSVPSVPAVAKKDSLTLDLTPGAHTFTYSIK
ncbi:MAG: PA14 domain-containing protein [Akkermansiaceae bacterium]